MNDWFEIFRTGTHTDMAGNTKEWTEKDLDMIATGYNSKQHEAPIVIGHPKDSAPAYGWVEALKREGNTLLAKAGKLVPEFVEAVKQGLYKKRSISLYPDMKLRHVGFLGAVPPAVKGLADIKFEETANVITIDLEEGANVHKHTMPVQRDGVSDISSVQRKGEVETGHIFQEMERMRNEILVLQKRHREVEFGHFCEKLVREGRLVPAQIGSVMSFLEICHAAGTYQFAEGKVSAVDKLKSFLEHLPKQIEYGEFAANGKTVDFELEEGRKIAAALNKGKWGE